MQQKPSGQDQRRQRRIEVALEVRVRGTDRQGHPFEETTQSANVSRGGCSIESAHEVAVGTELEIEILRRLPGRAEPTPFLTRGVVVRAAKTEDEVYSLGLRFTGPQFLTYSSENTAGE